MPRDCLTAYSLVFTKEDAERLIYHGLNLHRKLWYWELKSPLGNTCYVIGYYPKAVADYFEGYEILEKKVYKRDDIGEKTIGQ